MKNFFAFRSMVSSLIIKILYVIGIISRTGYAHYLIFTGEFLIGTGALLHGNLAWRLVCEGAIAIFSIHDVLVSIERKVYEEKQNRNHENRELFK